MSARIFIVEDEALIAEDLRRRLIELGHEVAGTAGSALEALTLMQASRPDLVLMDIVLRGRADGIAVADTIRAQWNIPVLYLTAYTNDETMARAKATNPLGILRKPFDTHTLRQAIDRALASLPVS